MNPKKRILLLVLFWAVVYGSSYAVLGWTGVLLVLGMIVFYLLLVFTVLTVLAVLKLQSKHDEA